VLVQKINTKKKNSSAKRGIQSLIQRNAASRSGQNHYAEKKKIIRKKSNTAGEGNTKRPCAWGTAKRGSTSLFLLKGTRGGHLDKLHKKNHGGFHKGK